MSTIDLETYLLRIAPDISVLDLVEKYNIENSGIPSDLENLIICKTIDSEKIKLPFYRGLFRLNDGTAEILDGDGNNLIGINAIYNEDMNVYVFIYNKPVYIKIDDWKKDNFYITGVAF